MKGGQYTASLIRSTVLIINKERIVNVSPIRRKDPVITVVGIVAFVLIPALFVPLVQQVYATSLVWELLYGKHRFQCGADLLNPQWRRSFRNYLTGQKSPDPNAMASKEVHARCNQWYR